MFSNLEDERASLIMNRNNNPNFSGPVSCGKCGQNHRTEECPHYPKDADKPEKKGCCEPCWCAVGGCCRKHTGLFNGELCTIS